MEHNTPEKKKNHRLRWLVNSLIGAISKNIGVKIISLMLAVLLWNYVITTNTSITRTKVLGGLTGYVTGQTTLSANRLALLTDPADLLNNISVTVEAPQSYYGRVSDENVLVSLDLSSVRTAGTQEVPLRATTTFGRVTEIVPETCSLTFEAQDSRSIPVNATFSGAVRDDYWYNVSRVNPSNLTVSGAASVVRSISSAAVYVDVTDRGDPFIQALPYTLLDTAGKEVSQEMLNLSSSSVSAIVDVYPTKDLPVNSDIANVLTGQPGEGYVVQSVSIQPDTVTVAADEELLESLTELMIEPIALNGAVQSFSRRAAISQLSGLRNLSTEQVYVNVVISESNVVGRIKDVNVVITGKTPGLSVEYNPITVIATGPRSAVEELQQQGIYVTLDITGLGPATYEIAPVFDQDRYPDVEFKPDPETVTVTLREIVDQ